MRTVWMLLLLSPLATAHEPCKIPADHTHARAGNPQCVAWWARPGLSIKESGGWVGGGCLGRGEGRGPLDGTWGWDYVGCGRYPGRVFLGWCHCQPRQMPAGTYKSDGPLVPDVFAIKPVKRAVEKHRGDSAE